MYTKFLISTKLALYNQDATKVLIMHYPPRGFNGLPGGHLEKNETPEQALRRELIEELSLEIGEVERCDFFLRSSAPKEPIILAFTARAKGDEVITPTDPANEYGEWVAKEDVQAIPNMTPEYIRFILENWPA